MVISLTLLVLTIPLVLTDPQAGLYSPRICGFPLQPRNGSVQVVWNASSFSQQNWEMSRRAVYSCDGNHMLVTKNWRKCSEGRWIGDVPQCAEVIQITKIRRDAKEIELGTGQWIPEKKTFELSTGKGRRLYGIRITALADYWNDFKAANWTLYGQSWRSLGIARKEIQEKVQRALLVFDPQTESVETIQLTPNKGFYISAIELWAYYDECGHPEVPVHGSVQWTTNDTTATYRCNDGYQLNSTSPTRHCHQGKWNGSEPICEPQHRENPSASSGAETNNLTIILIISGFCCVLLVALLTLCKKRDRCTISKRKNWAKRQRLEESRGDPTEQVEQTSSEIEMGENDAEVAERIRQNRQSRREWMEQQCQIYAELDLVQHSSEIESNEAIYSDVGTSRAEPVYAQVDKSKKTKRNY